MSESGVSSAEANPTARGAKAASATAALQLLPDFLQAMMYGNDIRKLHQLQQMVAALQVSHPMIARRMKHLAPQTLTTLPQCPTDLLSAAEPRFGLDAVVMAPEIRAELLSFVAEHRRSDELARFGLSPRNRVLLSGPPGNGKTMIAEAIARELGLAFFTADYCGLVDSHLGVTSRNVAKLFAYVNAVPCLVFLDEFDAVGASRGDGSDVREFRRVTNQVLVTLDRLSGQSVLVAATNAEGLIDPALKRRFDMPLVIDRPDRTLKFKCAQRELSPELTPGMNLLGLAEQVADSGAANLDEVTKLCRKLRRDAVLNNGRDVDRIVAETTCEEGKRG